MPALPTGALPRFARGAGLPLRAFGYLAARPALWPYAVVPALLTMLGLSLGLWLFWPLSAGLLGAVWVAPHGWIYPLWWLAHAALFVVMLFLAAVGLPVVAAAPFNDRLSAAVEKLELGAAAEKGGLRRFGAEIAVATWHSAARLALFALGQLLLLALLLIPAVNAAYGPLAFLWSATWLSFEYADLTMARHLYRFAQVRGALGRVRPLGLGMGCVLAAGFLVPLANFVMVPVGTVAGALLYCDLARDGLLPSRPEPLPAAA